MYSRTINLQLPGGFYACPFPGCRVTYAAAPSISRHKRECMFRSSFNDYNIPKIKRGTNNVIKDYNTILKEVYRQQKVLKQMNLTKEEYAILKLSSDKVINIINSRRTQHLYNTGGELNLSEKRLLNVSGNEVMKEMVGHLSTLKSYILSLVEERIKDLWEKVMNHTKQEFKDSLKELECKYDEQSKKLNEVNNKIGLISNCIDMKLSMFKESMEKKMYGNVNSKVLSFGNALSETNLDEKVI